MRRAPAGWNEPRRRETRPAAGTHPAARGDRARDLSRKRPNNEADKTKGSSTMHRLARVATTSAAGLFAFGLIGPAALNHTSAQTAIVGHVYVNDNTARSNTIAGFDRHDDGTLSPIPG